MKKLNVVGRIFLALGMLAASAQAQQPPSKPSAPKPAPTPSQAVLEQWNEVGRKIIAMAEDFPEDKYDFKPAPTVGSFAQRLIHVAHANQFLINIVRGEKMPEMDDPKRDQFKSKAEIVAFVKKSFADGAAAIQEKGDKGMSDLVIDPFANEQAQISDFAYGFVEHSGEIYGQLTVYYRVAGLVPPESRPKK